MGERGASELSQVVEVLPRGMEWERGEEHESTRA